MDWAEKETQRLLQLNMSAASLELPKALREAEARGMERAAKIARDFVHTRRDCEAGTTTDEIAELILTAKVSTKE